MDYGGIYVADGVTGQVINTTAAKMTGFATAGPYSDDSYYNTVVPDVANDKIYVTATGGYLACLTLSGENNNADQTIQANIRVQNAAGTATEIAYGQCISESETANEPFCMSVITPFEITQAVLTGNSGAVDVEVYLESSADTQTFIPTHAQLTVIRLT